MAELGAYRRSRDHGLASGKDMAGDGIPAAVSASWSDASTPFLR